MILRLRIVLNILIGILVANFLVACDGNGHSSPIPQAIPPKSQVDDGGGGMDSGGGNASKSTPQEVHDALKFALGLSGQLIPHENVFMRFAHERGTKDYSDYTRKTGHLFSFLHNINEKGEEQSIEFQYQVDPALRALAEKSSQIELRENESCQSADKKHAAASVSSHDLNAKICISVSELTRIPQQALLSEILALLLHETAHMAGADENEAQHWQNLFIEHFRFTFGDPTMNKADKIFLTPFLASLSKIQDTKLDHQANPQDVRTFGHLMLFAESLESLPIDFLDMQIRSGATDRDLFLMYSKEVKDLTRDAKIFCGIGEGYTKEAPNRSAEDISKFVTNATDRLYIIRHLFRRYLGHPGFESRCVDRTYENSKERRSFLYQYKRIIEKECTPPKPLLKGWD